VSEDFWKEVAKKLETYVLSNIRNPYLRGYFFGVLSVAAFVLFALTTKNGVWIKPVVSPFSISFQEKGGREFENKITNLSNELEILEKELETEKLLHRASVALNRISKEDFKELRSKYDFQVNMFEDARDSFAQRIINFEHRELVLDKSKTVTPANENR